MSCRRYDLVQGQECGQICRLVFQAKWRFRPLAAVHSLDQMTLHRSDSGHSFQVQQSHGCERRFIVSTLIVMELDLQLSRNRYRNRMMNAEFGGL
jgi:hypothetical protein